jgi:hypothetical protein
LSIKRPPLALAPATASVATTVGLAGTATSLVASVDVGEVVWIIVVVDSAVVRDESECRFSSAESLAKREFWVSLAYRNSLISVKTTSRRKKTYYEVAVRSRSRTNGVHSRVVAKVKLT